MWGFGLHLGNNLKTGVQGTLIHIPISIMVTWKVYVGPTQFVKIGQVVEAGQHSK